MRNKLLFTLPAIMLSVLGCDKPEVKPDDRITTEEMDEVLDDLWTDSTRAMVVREYLDLAGFYGWVVATGGSPHNKQLGEDLPLSNERIITTVDFYKAKGDFLIAGEIARDAAYAKQDGELIDLAIATYLEGARNEGVEYSARALCYKEASEFRSSSLEVNVARAREAIEFYIEAGDAESGYQILSNLFPGEYYTRNEKDERVLREEPKDEKLKKEELYALIEANKYQPFKANRTFPWEHFPYPRPEGDDSCDYLEWRAMRHDDYDFIFLLGEMRKTPEIECEPEQMLSIYESIGWFDHASEFAATHGFMERVGTYDFLSDELKVTNPKSKDYHGNLK